jgi:hypothetical protein
MQDASAQPPEDIPARPFRKDRSGSAHSRRYLAILCFMVAVTSALQHRADVLGLPQSLLTTLLQYGNGLVALMWMRADSRLRGAPIPGGGLLLAAVLLPLAVPAYILWTRRWKGLLVFVVALLAIMVAIIVGQSATRLALGLPIVNA